MRAWCIDRGLHRRKLALQVFELPEQGGLRNLGGRGQVLEGPVGGCQVLGGAVGAYLWLSGRRRSEEKLEALLDDHPEDMKLLDDKLTKHKLVPVLVLVLILILMLILAIMMLLLLLLVPASAADSSSDSGHSAPVQV